MNTTIISVANLRRGAGSLVFHLFKYCVFSHNFTAAKLVFQNNETVAMLMSQSLSFVPIILHGCRPRVKTLCIFKKSKPNFCPMRSAVLSHVACVCGLMVFLSSERKPSTAEVAFLSCLAVYLSDHFIYLLFVNLYEQKGNVHRVTYLCQLSFLA